MTNAELIVKIKAEIERLKATNPSEYNYQNAEGCVWALDDVISFISTLESEKPMQEGLEEEIDRLWESFADEMEGPHNLFDIYARLARHFAEWQKAQDDRLVDIIYQQGIEKGKDDMKEQMMKEAVKTRVIGLGLCDTPHVVLGLSDEFKDGDKVRVIVLPMPLTTILLK